MERAEASHDLDAEALALLEGVAGLVVAVAVEALRAHFGLFWDAQPARDGGGGLQAHIACGGGVEPEKLKAGLDRFSSGTLTLPSSPPRDVDLSRNES